MMGNRNLSSILKMSNSLQQFVSILAWGFCEYIFMTELRLVVDNCAIEHSFKTNDLTRRWGKKKTWISKSIID